MKLLWLSHFVPFPPRGGAHQRSFNLIRQASRQHEIILVALNRAGEDSAQTSKAKRELGCLCRSVEIWEPAYAWKGRQWWLELAVSPFCRAPFGCQAIWSPSLDARWRETLQTHPDALIHFDSSDLALYVPAAAARRKVLNHHNCESEMAYRRAQKEPNPIKKAFLIREAGKLARMESEICPQFDVNLAVSEQDSQLLLGRDPNVHVHVVQNGTDTDYFTPSGVNEEDDTVIFAGSLRWYPNIAAVQFFIHKIWPLVKKERPGARCCVAGQFPSGELVRALSREPGVEVVASPDDIRPWISRAAAFVCPIQDGGGTRVKILDAWAMGKAIVSTSVGCEGLPVKEDQNIIVADTPKEFASGVVTVLQDPALRRKLGQAGRLLVEKEYDWRVIGAALERAYRCAIDRRSCADHS
jgi:glycosyltransferase involved in cell wall biosynthesis